MKRTLIALTALFSTMQFPKDKENPECPDASCAAEQTVAKPEFPHGPEAPEYTEFEDRVEILGSPVTSVAVGSELHSWLKTHGVKVDLPLAVNLLGPLPTDLK